MQKLKKIEQFLQMFSQDARKQQRLKDDIFNFFVVFSRFEFALKESGYLKDKKVAEPSWDKFVTKYKTEFSVNEDIQESYIYLTSEETRPNKQKTNKTNQNGEEVFNTYWDKFNLDAGAPELKKACDVVLTIRNNLFHGGKYGEKTWNDPEKTTLFVNHSVVLILAFTKLDEDIQVYFENFA
ncbi:hypothetical protein C1S99_25215 [Vibrio parahaemolyticus]|uniref:hypothetical protein n=1 Tax=Vibrio parahaemolyticus TaxID=670 RepID=UPI000C869F70|nr:hypothetical protein [Vibrio parahaemolyticus]EJB8691729.1 hypothetical protein [Vibrio parahaemolyticus]MDF4372305.1 hypothetical protein [Vibrio parahaemolyticus]PMS39125.1 hypothetical protein C1T12_25900 [Vibrio parahaemolyticus]PMS58014.1 hypothetical protein C1S91_25385 [Vibrio parahaemolyticus]PMS65368.1 hypothetical protein C1S96_25235 [Vibrio parahaemolyticus]